MPTDCETRVESQGAPAVFLSEFQSLYFDPIRADLCEVVMGLLRQPGRRVATEDLGQSYRHFGRDTALAVYQFGQSGARNSESMGSLGDGQVLGSCTAAAQSLQNVADSSSTYSVSSLPSS
jgi:hypothetical protein